MPKPMARPKSRRPKRAEPRRKPAAGARTRPSVSITRPPLAATVADHARVILASLGRLAAHPLSTLMTVAVIGIALALPAGLHLLVTNGMALGGQWEGAAELSVYLGQDVDADEAKRLAAELEAYPEIDRVTLILAEEALVEFREHSGFAASLEALPDNPLPHVLVALPAEDSRTAEAVEALREKLAGALPADLVQADTAWVARLQAILDLLRRSVLLAGLLLAVGVALIVGNTIRLDIQNRRDEIEVAKLIGATDAFIRRPFLYTGVWYGLMGGLLALALVVGSLLALEDPVRRLSGLYGSGFRLAGPGLAGSAVLAGTGIALGWLGSWVSATRNMRRIEPGAQK